MSKKTDKITFNKRMLLWIVPLMPIVGIIISKHQIGSLMLLIIGVTCGVFIGRNSK